MSALLPCPHCGGAATSYPRTCDRNAPYDARDCAFPIVRCGLCFATSPGKDWSNEDTAIIAWNTRAQPAPDPLLDQMAEALRDMWAGWTYIRCQHGDLYGVGWDRAHNAADAALSAYDARRKT